MTSRISHTSFDARNAYAQSVFWSQVLDFVEDPDDPNEPGHAECLITSRDLSQLLLFITVPDGKAVKNRVHLDLRPVDRTREEEVPTANSMPVKVAPSGTGAVPVRVSGPVMPAYARPACSQNTRPQRTPATDVIAVTCSLVQVHTVSTHGESDPRIVYRSPTGEGYVASRSWWLARPSDFAPGQPPM